MFWADNDIRIVRPLELDTIDDLDLVVFATMKSTVSLLDVDEDVGGVVIGLNDTVADTISRQSGTVR